MSRQKRRKLEQPPFDRDEAVHHALPEIVSQIDTEINIRDRLAQTLEARIEWALALRTVLQKGKGRGLQTTPENFQELASEALINAELPAQALFSTPQAVPPAAAIEAQAPFRRPPPKPKATFPKGKPTFLYVRSQARASTAARPEGEAYLLLKCPVCSRTAFSSLQGLLNHARISHSIEWGTHDACIKACAVEEPGLDVDSGNEVGVGPLGIRPGLQTLFERAVGVQQLQQQPYQEQQEQQQPLFVSRSESYEDPNNRQASPHGASPSTIIIPNVTQNLGIHQETPALAPFLGKEVRRREIKVYDEGVDIAFDDNDKASEASTHVHASLLSKRRNGSWKMSFAPRNQPLSDVAVNVNLPESLDRGANVGDDDDGGDEGNEPVEGEHALVPRMSVPSPAALGVPSSKSRFHFSARVTISDRSLFVPLVSTSEGSFSRKWMIAVDSPSYAVPLSSVLKHVKVTPVSTTDTFYLPVPVVREPPYVVIGMSNVPFLARVEMVFNDIKEDSGQAVSHNREPQSTVIEHWVDLDPFKSASVVLGEEQLLDIELDRRTEVKAAIPNSLSFESKRLWNDLARLPLESVQTVKSENQEARRSEEHILLLETAKRFPLTQQGRDRNQTETTTNVPYKLVSTRAQFSQLILGRQQAIKWGRARAIRNSYLNALESANLEALPTTLSVADIYRWLEENLGSAAAKPNAGNILGEAKDKTTLAVKSAGDDAKIWCPHCGFEEKLHSSLSEPQTKSEEEKMSSPSEDGTASCVILHNIILPQAHANPITAFSASQSRPTLPSAKRTKLTPTITLVRSGSQNPNRVLVQSVDPALLSFVQQIVENACIPAFQRSQQPQHQKEEEQAEQTSFPSDRRDLRRYPIDSCGSNRDQVEENLASLAVLTHSVQRFVVEMVGKGARQAALEKGVVMRVLGSVVTAAKRSGGGGRRLVPGAARDVRAEQVDTVLTPRHLQTGNSTSGLP